MYRLLVLLQTLILPAVSGLIQLAVHGGNPLVVFGCWMAFWGSARGFWVAGISQLLDPARTAQGILGIESTDANQVVHELGYANLSLGIVPLAVPLLPAWGYRLRLGGALHLGLAGMRHVAKPGKDRDELVATWTDLWVCAVVVLGAVATLAAQ